MRSAHVNVSARRASTSLQLGSAEGAAASAGGSSTQSPLAFVAAGFGKLLPTAHVVAST